MSILKLFAIINALCVLMAGAPQIDSFEKQALSLAQATPASDLDAKLPGQSFAAWLEQILSAKTRGAKTRSAKAGMVWQLTECGRRDAPPYEAEGALPACVEIIALLPDKRRVFITIRVGTFKDGLIGKPAFFRAAIERQAKLYTVRQLYELPEMLRSQDSVSDGIPDKRRATKTKNRVVNLPTVKAPHEQFVRLSQYSSPPSTDLPGSPGLMEPPPLRQDSEKVSESLLQSRAINRVSPVYPPHARKLNATGTVEVEVTISEAGIVVDARAVNGPLALRGAAVEAARKWIFKPAILNDTPVKIKGVLTFTFGPGAK